MKNNTTESVSSVKRFLSEEDINRMFNTPRIEPVIVKAAPGTGKTTSILYDLRLKADVNNELILLIVNRASLRMQLLQEIIIACGIDLQGSDLGEQKVYTIDNLVITSYQYLAALFDANYDNNIKVGQFSCWKYNYVIADEIHYLQVDSAFSSNSDQIMRLAKVFFNAKRIYLTGTLTPLIRELILEIEGITDNGELFEDIPCFREFRYVRTPSRMEQLNRKYSGNSCPYSYTKVHEIQGPEPYNQHLSAHFISEDTDLADDIIRNVKADGTNKIVAFVRSKENGKETLKILRNKGISAVFIFSERDERGEHMDKESKAALTEIIQNRTFKQQVLLSTSVMDNGINILSPDITHVYTDEYEYISLVQEIARVRYIESNQKVCLIFRKYSKRFFQEEKKRIQARIDQVNEVTSISSCKLAKYFYYQNYNLLGGIISFNSNGRIRINSLAKRVLEDKIDFLDSLMISIDVGQRFVETVTSWLNIDYDSDKDAVVQEIIKRRADVKAFIESYVECGILKEQRREWAARFRELYELIPDKRVVFCSDKGSRVPGVNKIDEALSEWGYRHKLNSKTKKYELQKINEEGQNHDLLKCV